MRGNHSSVRGWTDRGIAIATLALLSSSSLMLGTALAGHQGYTHAPAGFVSATDFGTGFNAVESTAALRLAFDSGMDIFVPKMASSWITDQLFLTQDNQTILFEEGVVVEALAGAFIGGNDSLLFAESVDNVRLEGYGATFRMRQADYTDPAPGSLYYPQAQWRMGIRLHSVTNFDVVGLTIEDTGGDGVYVRGTFSVPGALSEDVIIQDVTINNAFRNGISVISAKNLLIDNATIINTLGTIVGAGIDIEPNDPGDSIVNVTIQNSIIQGNAGNGIQFSVEDGEHNEPVTGLIQNVTVIGNGAGGLRLTKGALPNFAIKDSLLIMQGDDGINVTGGDGSTLQTISYSVSRNNADDDFANQVFQGDGIVEDNEVLDFVSTDINDIDINDINDPLFFFLDSSTSTDITEGASDGSSYIGARPVSTGLAGDYNNNGIVDAADYVVWRDNLGKGALVLNGNGSVGPTGSLAVRQTDYDLWKANFGNTLGSGSGAATTAVPEPSAALLLLAGLVAGSSLLRRRERNRGAGDSCC